MMKQETKIKIFEMAIFWGYSFIVFGLGLWLGFKIA